jgi:L-lactate utilization protein LutC
MKEEKLARGWKKTIFVAIGGTELRITATYQGKSVPPWDNRYHNKYRITISNLKEMMEWRENRPKFTHVNFWDSLVNTEEMKPLSSEDILLAFKDIIEDALAVIEWETPEEFAKAFLYDEKEARRVFRECKKIYEELERIGLDREKIDEIERILVEKENEDKLHELITMEK